MPTNLLEKPIPINFEPREYQWPLLIALGEDEFKRVFIVWHRRCGKDKALWNFLIGRASQIVGQHYYLFPTYAQGKKILWEGIDNDGFKFLDHIPKDAIDGKPNDTEMKITLKNGSIIQIIGTDNYDAIRGTNPKTCVFSEYAYQDPRAWDVLRPILKVNGGVAIFNTTPNGENHAFDLWNMANKNKDWFCEILTINDTNILTEADIDKERKEGMSEEMIQQEYYCSWSASLVGAYYGKRMRELEETERITDVPWDDLAPVTTFWDIGVNDEMTIIFVQRQGFIYKIIDSYSNHGEGFEHYAGVLKRKSYMYDQHCLPHDAKVREMSKRASEGMERYKTLDSLLREPIVVLKRPKSVPDKIEASRWVLPKCYFDKEKCNTLINALKSYRQKYDERLKIWVDEPLHDWSSHFADAFAYFALHARNNWPKFDPASSQSQNEHGMIQTNYPSHQSGDRIRR